ncbi:MAG: PucR family transcriptional regulator [Nitriliruptorales bacterium]|nr:PucR family transcriptional regulator [Nitriliruptorales bacterium]
MRVAAGLSLAARVERRIDDLASSMVDAFVEEVPIYRQLPREQLQGEVLDISRTNLRTFLMCLRERREPTDEELAEARASAARRAEERIPLDSVLTAYHIGGRIGWRALADEAKPGERDQLDDLAERVMRYLQRVTGAVASAYMEEQQLIYGEQRDARRALTEALLVGARDDAGTPLGQARRAGVHLAAGYMVLILRMENTPDEQKAGVTGAVAGRRKVRRVQAALDRLAGEPVLNLLEADGGPVLFPAGPDSAIDAVRAAHHLVTDLAAAAGAPVLAGVSWARGSQGVADAADEARDVVELASRLHRPTGTYRLDDVLLEHAVTHPRDTADRLTAVLAPIDDRPDLVETLEQWYAADFDRRSAAAALNVHPNTLDYRLRRVAELTGTDTGSSRGLQLLGAAITARRFRQADADH